MRRRVRIGTNGKPDPVGKHTGTGEDLVAVDDKLVTLDAGACFECREVGARIGFGVADGKDQLARQDRTQEEVLLSLRPVLDQSGSDGVQRDQRQRRIGANHLVVEHVQSFGVLAPTAEFLRPPQAQPTVFTHSAQNAIEDGAAFGLIHESTAVFVVDDLREVRPQFLAQSLRLLRQIQVHGETPKIYERGRPSTRCAMTLS